MAAIENERKMTQQASNVKSPRDHKKRVKNPRSADGPSKSKLPLSPAVKPQRGEGDSHGSPERERDKHNQTYLDKSLDMPEDASRHGNNPAYDDSSATRRPNLPYPGQHYDIYRK